MTENPGHSSVSRSDPVLCLVALCLVKVKTFHNWLMPQSRLDEIVLDAIFDSDFMTKVTQVASTEIIDFITSHYSYT